MQQIFLFDIGQASNWNNPFRSLEEEFDKEHQPERDTPPQILHTTPEVGVSTFSGPTLEFLHRLMQNSPSFVHEVMKFQKMMTRQTEIVEENAGKGTTEKKNEEIRLDKAPAVQVLESEGDSLDEREDEIRRLKKQVERLQEGLKDNGRRESQTMEEVRRSEDGKALGWRAKPGSRRLKSLDCPDRPRCQKPSGEILLPRISWRTLSQTISSQ